MAKIDILMITEEMLQSRVSSKNGLTIGVPKENLKEEKRLVLTPEAVSILTLRGHHVVIERGAGEGVGYSDVAYSEAGALVAESPKDAFACDLVLKIAPPLPEEVALMKTRAALFSMISLDALSQECVNLLLKRKITAAAYDMLLDDDGEYCMRNLLDEIEGTAAILIASHLMSNLSGGGKGVLLGGIPGIAPVEVIILGAGQAGIAAARAAIGTGAAVKIFDNNINRLHNIKNTLGPNIFTSTLHPNVMQKAFLSADVVIGAMPCSGGIICTPVSEDLVRSMKKGALIIDLQLRHGGCFETTNMQIARKPELYKVFGVLHYCKANISSLYARTTAISLSNAFLPVLNRIGELGGVEALLKTSRNFGSGVYMYGGQFVNEAVAAYFNKPYFDLSNLSSNA